MAERIHTGLRILQREHRRQKKEKVWRPDVPPYERPKTRGDCKEGFRPCPFYGCRYHLGLDVTYAGGIRMPFGEHLEEMTETCALDVADQGDHELHKLAKILNYNKERARQIIFEAIAALRFQMSRSEDLAETRRKSLAGFLSDETVLDEPKKPLHDKDGGLP